MSISFYTYISTEIRILYVYICIYIYICTDIIYIYICDFKTSVLQCTY